MPETNTEEDTLEEMFQGRLFLMVKLAEIFSVQNAGHKAFTASLFLLILPKKVFVINTPHLYTCCVCREYVYQILYFSPL